MRTPQPAPGEGSLVPAAPGGAAASMGLLALVQRDALDPDYARAAARRAPRRRWLGILGVAVATTMGTMAALQTSRTAPLAQSERGQLISQVRAEQERTDQLRSQADQLDAKVRELQADRLATPAAGQVDEAAAAGQTAVHGPGITVVVDDAPDDQEDHVADTDLRRLVNGLWQAGAEAVAVNGHRITARTAIRSAGSAITVDYRSLNRPYKVEAIGDPRGLGGTFATTDGGQWWSFLHDNNRFVYEVHTADRLDLPADPSLGVTRARVVR